MGESIDSGFHEQQLLGTDQEIYRIEKGQTNKSNSGKVLVKWKDYPDGLIVAFQSAPSLTQRIVSKAKVVALSWTI